MVWGLYVIGLAGYVAVVAGIERWWWAPEARLPLRWVLLSSVAWFVALWVYVRYRPQYHPSPGRYPLPAQEPVTP